MLYLKQAERMFRRHFPVGWAYPSGSKSAQKIGSSWPRTFPFFVLFVLVVVQTTARATSAAQDRR